MDTKKDGIDEKDFQSIENTPIEPVRAMGSELKSGKRKKVRAWIWVLLAMVILAGAGVIAYFYLYPSNSKPVDNSAKSVATHFESASELVSKVKSDLKGSELPVTTADGMGGKTADGFWAYSFANYQTSGSKFKSLPTKGTGAGFTSDSTVATSNYKALVDFFAANKFKSVEGATNQSGPIGLNIDDVNYPSYDVYGSNDILCAIFHADASGTSLKAHVVGIGCADKSAYKDAATALTPFYTAYTSGSKSPTTGLVFGTPIVADGKDGYKNAQVYQEDASQTESGGKANFVGFYLKAATDKDWSYVTSSHSIPFCSFFKTDDVLMKAFAGTSCVDDTTKKTVTVQ